MNLQLSMTHIQCIIILLFLFFGNCIYLLLCQSYVEDKADEVVSPTSREVNAGSTEKDVSALIFYFEAQ